jgi:hypothetical protein
MAARHSAADHYSFGYFLASLMPENGQKPIINEKENYYG